MAAAPPPARERDLKDGQKALLGLPRTPPPAQAGAAPAPADKQGGAAPARSPQPLGPPVMQARRSAPSAKGALWAYVCCRWACVKGPRRRRGRQAAPVYVLQESSGPGLQGPPFVADNLAVRTAWHCDAWRRQPQAAAGRGWSSPFGSSLSLHT